MSENLNLPKYLVSGYFGLFFCCISFVALLRALGVASLEGDGIAVLAVLFAVLVVALFAIGRANDVFVKRSRCSSLLIVAAGGGVLFTCLAGVEVCVAAAFAALCAAVLVIAWLSFLGTANSSERIVAISFALFGIGILTFFSVDLSLPLLLALYLTGTVASLICLWIIGNSLLSKACLSTRAENLVRLQDCGGSNNFFALVVIGMLAGMITRGFALCDAAALQASWFLVGIAAALAGALFAVCSKRWGFAFYNAMRKLLGPFAVILILAWIVVPGYGQGTVTVAVTMVSFVYLAIVILGSTEIAHFEELSPIWLYGREGFSFCVGSLVGVAALGVCEQYAALAPMMYSLLIVLVSFFQIRIIAKGQYPFIEEQEQVVESVEPSFAPASVVEKWAWTEVAESIAAEYVLSPRQKEVFTLLAKGRDIKFIADEFVVSPSTVKSHVYMLYKKLGIHSQQELISLVDERMRTEKEKLSGKAVPQDADAS